MELFIGNNSNKRAVVYRSVTDPTPMHIKPGWQAMAGDLNQEDADALIAHEAKYGMIQAKDGDYPAGLVFSMDGPIPGLLSVPSPIRNR